MAVACGYRMLAFARYLGVGLTLLATALIACSPNASRDASVEGEASDIESADDVFGSAKDFAFGLEAPFNQLFTRYSKRQPDPPKPGEDAGGSEASYSETGKLVLGGRAFDVRVELRGNSSKWDCTFFKYKIAFTNKEQIKRTEFQGNKKFRVNSHCGDGGPEDRPPGRIRVLNEISPIREEMVYRLVRAAGVPTYRTRLAKIAYKDTSSESPLSPIERHGLLIEAGDVAAKRFAAEGLIDKERGVYIDYGVAELDGTGANVSVMKDEDLARAFLVEVLAGNLDWRFSRGSPGSIFNLDVFGVPVTGPQLAIPQDFDISNAVAAWMDPVKAVSGEMVKVRTIFASDPATVARAAAGFKAKKAGIEAELADIEKAYIAAGRIPSTDGVTSTDPGFIRTHQQLEAFFALDELR